MISRAQTSIEQSASDKKKKERERRQWFAVQPVLSQSCRRSGLAASACYKESKHSNNNRKSNKKHSSWKLGECGNSFRGPAKRNIINIWHCFMEKLLDFIPRHLKWPRMINYHGWDLCAFLYTAYGVTVAGHCFFLQMFILPGASWPHTINTAWKVCPLEKCGKAMNGAVLGLGFGSCGGCASLQRFDLWIQKTNEVVGVPPCFFCKINSAVYGGGMFYEWWRPPQAIHIPEPPRHRGAPWHREAGIRPSFLFAAQYIMASRRHQR